MGVRHSTRLLAVAAVSASVASACAFGPQYSNRITETRPVVLTVVDERGEPVEGARIVFADRELRTDEDGEVVIKVSQPVSAVVRAPGALDEPAAIAPGDVAQTIKLWSRFGAGGVERLSMHFGGDVMLGRRYLQSDRTDTPIVTDAPSARAVVSDIAAISSAADWTVVNLETVIGEFPPTDASTAKRFLLQSTPYVTDLLDELGVDLVTLGNNHSYDWGEAGIASTIAALGKAGIQSVGAGADRAEAIRGTMVSVGDRTVGVVSFTTVNGSFVNDQLPSADEPLPAALPATELWQYSRRDFGFGDPGDQLYIKPDQRRISEIWSLFDQLETDLGDEAVAELWSAMITVYPELQDWVARRGHGGAAQYRREDMEDQIKQLKRSGAGMIIVQIHGGFQFAEVESEFLQGIAHAAIDAGADAVIAHHPHVLQGVEWYRDKLVVYSLGNFVFDQDFLETFPSAMLRLVTEGSKIIEARMLPMMLNRYRPVPVTGNTAAQIVRMIDERSALPAVAARLDELEVGTELQRTPANIAGLVSPASLRLQRNTGLIVKDRLQREQLVSLDGNGIGELASCGLVRSDRIPSTVELGVDVYGWGRFDDDTADGHRDLPMHWTVPDDPDRWSRTAGRTLDPVDDAIELLTDPERTTTMRLLARVDIAEHRLFDKHGVAIDTPPRLEITMDVKRDRGEQPSMRFLTFDFDDSDPTRQPTTTRMSNLEFPIDVPADDSWHTITVPLPTDLFATDAAGHQANAATLLIDSRPALRGRLAIDNLRIVEWRGPTASDQPTWLAADLVHSTGSRAVTLTVSGC